jgi:hypothetical protein
MLGRFGNLVVNCSGAGARQLCDDKAVYGMQGQKLKRKQKKKKNLKNPAAPRSPGDTVLVSCPEVQTVFVDDEEDNLRLIFFIYDAFLTNSSHQFTRDRCSFTSPNFLKLCYSTDKADRAGRDRKAHQ